jgi:hypothetical protein
MSLRTVATRINARVRTLVVVVIALACTDQSRVTAPASSGPTVTGPQLTIADASQGYKTGFYWLPPMVQQPVVTGVFDAALSPVIDICQLEGATCVAEPIATFTMTSGPGSERVRIDAAGEHYIANWHTDEFAVAPGQHYRISVRAGDNVLLGFTDVEPVTSGKEMKNVNTGEYVGLVDGRTLPIKFRIESGIVGRVVVQPTAATVFTGATQQFTASVTDLHGSAMQTPVVWASSDHAVATVDENGLAAAVAIGEAEITASAERVTGRAALKVVPDPRNMTLRTAWEADGGRIDRTHRAVAGEATLLDVDGVAGADLAVDVDYTSSGIAIAIVRAPGTTSGVLTINAVRDAAAADERVLQVRVDRLPAEVSFAFNSDSRRMTGSVSGASVDRVTADITAGSLPGALNLSANIQGILDGFELSFPSDVHFTSTSGVDLVDVAIRSPALPPASLPPGTAGMLFRSDASGLQLTLRLFGARRLDVVHPLSVNAVGSAAPAFTVALTRPTSSASLQLTGAPTQFALELSELSTPTGLRGAVAWQASGPTGRMVLSASGAAAPGGGLLTADVQQVSAVHAFSVVLPPPGAVGPVRFDVASTNAGSSMSLVAQNAGGLPQLSLQLADVPTTVRGCIAPSSDCRPADRVPSPIPGYDGSSGNPPQSSTAGGLNRPYPAIVSFDFDDAGTGASALRTKLNATVHYAPDAPITITDLRFQRFTLDLGLQPSSPTFLFEGQPLPRVYLYIDSNGQPYSLGQLTTPGIVQSFRAGSSSPAVANRLLAWLPGTKCTSMVFGICLSTDLDPRVGGTHNCGSPRQFIIRALGLEYDLLGRQLLPICG